MQTAQQPDGFQAIADQIVADAIAAYKAGTDYNGELTVLGDTVKATNEGIYDKPYNPFDSEDGKPDPVRIGSKLTVEVKGRYKGRYDSDLVTAAIDEHGPDFPLASTEYVEFFEKLTARGVWREDKTWGNGYEQVLCSCEEPVGEEVAA